MIQLTRFCVGPTEFCRCPLVTTLRTLKPTPSLVLRLTNIVISIFLAIAIFLVFQLDLLTSDKNLDPGLKNKLTEIAQAVLKLWAFCSSGSFYLNKSNLTKLLESLMWNNRNQNGVCLFNNRRSSFQISWINAATFVLSSTFCITKSSNKTLFDISSGWAKLKGISWRVE